MIKKKKQWEGKRKRERAREERKKDETLGDHSTPSSTFPGRLILPRWGDSFRRDLKELSSRVELRATRVVD